MGVDERFFYTKLIWITDVCILFTMNAGIGRSKENDRHRVPNSSHESCGLPQKHDLSCVHGKIGKPGISRRFFGHRLDQHNRLLCPLRSSHGHGTPLHPSLRFSKLVLTLSNFAENNSHVTAIFSPHFSSLAQPRISHAMPSPESRHNPSSNPLLLLRHSRPHCQLLPPPSSYLPTQQRHNLATVVVHFTIHSSTPSNPHFSNLQT